MTAKTAKRTSGRKRTPAPPVIEVDDDDDDEILGAELEPDAETGLENILAELGGSTDATISVKKAMASGEAYIGKFMPSEFDLDTLRDRYGGGTYWCYVHVGGKIKHKRRVMFAQSLAELRGDAPSTAAAATSEATIAGVLDRMANQQRELVQLVLQRPQGPDMMQMIDAAAKLANLNGKRENGLQDFMQMFKLAREMSGEAGGSMLGEFAAEFVRSIRGDQVGRLLPSPAPAPSTTESQNVTTGADMQAIVKAALAKQLPVLIRGAQNNTDARSYADLLLDQVPQIYLSHLVGFLKREDWFTLLVQADGAVVPYQTWFEQLRNEIIQATVQPDPPPP